MSLTLALFLPVPPVFLFDPSPKGSLKENLPPPFFSQASWALCSRAYFLINSGLTQPTNKHSIVPFYFLYIFVTFKLAICPHRLFFNVLVKVLVWLEQFPIPQYIIQIITIYIILVVLFALENECPWPLVSI